MSHAESHVNPRGGHKDSLSRLSDVITNFNKKKDIEVEVRDVKIDRRKANLWIMNTKFGKTKHKKLRWMLKPGETLTAMENWESVPTCKEILKNENLVDISSKYKQSEVVQKKQLAEKVLKEFSVKDNFEVRQY